MPLGLDGACKTPTKKQRVLAVKLEIPRCFDNHKDRALSGVMTRCASSNGDRSWGVPLGIGLVTVKKTSHGWEGQ